MYTSYTYFGKGRRAILYIKYYYTNEMKRPITFYSICNKPTQYT